MLQDFKKLSLPEIELIEKMSLRVIVQAVQEYSKEARTIFENTAAPSENEVIVLAEDLVQYALEVAECYPIDKRYAGFIDYKRARWIATPFGLIPQVLLVDAKASTENTRTTLQQSQLPVDADFASKDGIVHHLPAGLAPELSIETIYGATLRAVTTSAFVHFYYRNLEREAVPYRKLISIFLLLLPHQCLKSVYNPSPEKTFFGQGKHSPKRDEQPRIRVYFGRLRAACPWRLQELQFSDCAEYSRPVWRDIDPATGVEVEIPFDYIGR